MKKAKWIVLGVLGVAAFVALAVFLNDIKAAMWTGKLEGFTLAKGQPPDSVSNEGIIGFVGIHENAVPFLLKNMEHEDDGVRLGSLIALGKINSTRAGAKYLLEALQNPKSPEDSVLVWALVKHKDLVAKDIPGILKSTKNNKTRMFCLQFIARASDSSTGPLLAESLSDPDLSIVVAAAEALQVVKYPQAVPALIQAAKNLHKAGNADGVQAVCLALTSNIDAKQSGAIFAELGSNEVPKLLDACRAYARSLPESDVVFFVKNAFSGDNKVEKESARVVLEKITPAAKQSTALALLKLESTEAVLLALELLASYGNADTLPLVVDQVEAKDMDIAKAAVLALGGIIERNKVGRIPTYGYLDENPREQYIELLLDKIQVMDLRNVCNEVLENICDPQPRIGTSAEAWQEWWDDYRTVGSLVRELKDSMEQIKQLMQLEKTKVNLEKAKKIADNADIVCSKLEEIATRITKIAGWVDKQRNELNQLRYAVNKSKPLDVMQ